MNKRWRMQKRVFKKKDFINHKSLNERNFITDMSKFGKSPNAKPRNEMRNHAITILHSEEKSIIHGDRECCYR